MKLRAAALVFPLALTSCGGSQPIGAPGVPWQLRVDSWRTDPVWDDGLAEVCVYAATRTIYGVPRDYEATVYTNKQHMDLSTTTKASGAGGVEVFKQHAAERVPTENYDYDFSTATFTVTRNLAPYKLTAATQEDCGASFKQVWRDGAQLRWSESVYFPGAGMAEGLLARDDAQFVDALPLVLRDFPFEASPGEGIVMWLVPSQKDTHRVPFEPVACEVVHIGEEVCELPLGQLEAHHLRVTAEGGGLVGDYWFAADGGAPLLHALVRYEGPDGQSYRLSSLGRRAYWER